MQAGAVPEAAATGEDGAPVASLPRELLSHVFGLLDVAERSRASRVCRRWRAAALDPPHSTSLSLRLHQEWKLDADLDPVTVFDDRGVYIWREENWAPDPAALTVAELPLAFGSPLAAGVTSLSVALGRAAEPPAAGQNSLENPVWKCWPLGAVLEAVPASVTSLSLSASGVTTLYIEVDLIFDDLDRLQELAPQLRELKLHSFVLWDWVPKHAGLERLIVDPSRTNWTPSPRDLLNDLPSLQRLSTLNLSNFRLPSEEQCRILTALARRGLRVRTLSLNDNADLVQKGMIDAISTLFEPKAVDFGGGPAQLTLSRLPRTGVPDKFAADAEEIKYFGTPWHSILPWITAISRGPSLRRLTLYPDHLRQCASPCELLAALQGCREGLQVEIHFPPQDIILLDPDGVSDAALAWTMEGFAKACTFLARDHALLRAVSIEPSMEDNVFGMPGHIAAAHNRYRAEQLIALGEHHQLSEDEAKKLRSLLRETEENKQKMQKAFRQKGQQPTDKQRAELALIEELIGRLRVHLPHFGN